jgi:uncharacterized membrane protein YdjX (TVP38/TMEM64 family)
VLEAVQNPVAYFFAMIVVLSAASIPPSAPTLMAAKANAPWLLATLAVGAGAVASVFDYALVRRVFRLGALDRVRHHRLFEKAEHWARVAPFLTVFAFAALPLPFMIPRVLVPLSGYPRSRYVAAAALGRWPRIFVLATFGHLVDVPAWLLELAFAAALASAALGAVVRRMGRADAATPPPSPAPPVPVGSAPANDAGQASEPSPLPPNPLPPLPPAA